ncbi:hypothetical protein DSM112329_03969 [Paraconexibacter sp. AEG42_29]|uniref:Uncharacterized protein n=2 Tax=Paraconexibacter sp. AEG42_29 TaxID=2997339 RepID=A0AAU7AZD9_9ACTN
MQQVIKALEAEREEVRERLAWLDQTIEDFQARESAPPQVEVPPAPKPKRAVRRGTAARASNRRHVARAIKPDPAERIVAFLKEHPGSTIGAVAKGLDANRSTIASQIHKLDKQGDILKLDKGYRLPDAPKDADAA